MTFFYVRNDKMASAFGLLFAEVALEKTHKACAVARFVLCHFVHGVVCVKVDIDIIGKILGK